MERSPLDVVECPSGESTTTCLVVPGVVGASRRGGNEGARWPTFASHGKDAPVAKDEETDDPIARESIQSASPSISK